MKDPFCVIFVFSILFVSTNEQCLQSDESSTITSCEGSTKYGSNIHIDFYKINNTCTCTVSPSFAGELLVVSRGIIYFCSTKVYVNDNETTVSFGCQTKQVISHAFNVLINESVEVRAEDESSSTSGTFYYCLVFKENGGSNGNLSVMCGSPPETATTTVSSAISTNTLTSLQISHASSPLEPSIETTTTPTSTLSSGTINVSYGSLSMESTTDNPEMLYIIAGSAGGGAIILVGLIVVILVLIKRSRSARNKNGCTEADMARTNEVFDSNPELPDNPLYLSSQPMDELGYSSDQEKQLGLPPTDSKTKKNVNSDYDVPPNNKPIGNSASLMPVYAVPKMGNDRTPNVSTGDVYAEVCKPDRSTEQAPVRNRNEDGLLYMEVEQDTAATKQTNTNDKNEITEGVCYAEIKRT